MDQWGNHRSACATKLAITAIVRQIIAKPDTATVGKRSDSIVNETERVLAAARLRGGHSVTVAPVQLSSDVGAFGTRATRSAQRMLESQEIPARSFDVARHRDDRELRGEHARSGL